MIRRTCKQIFNIPILRNDSKYSIFLFSLSGGRWQQNPNLTTSTILYLYILWLKVLNIYHMRIVWHTSSMNISGTALTHLVSIIDLCIKSAFSSVLCSLWYVIYMSMVIYQCKTSSRWLFLYTCLKHLIYGTCGKWLLCGSNQW